MSEAGGRRDHHPVVIVGSGPTGLTLANLLGTFGTPCLLVERNRTTVQEPRAVSIDDESLRTMQAAGVVEAVQSRLVSGYGSHYYSPRGICFAKVEPSGRPYGYPRRNAFRQPVLEDQLRQGLERFPDKVETLFGWHLDDYEQDADRVTARLRRADGSLREVTCDYLVGCDGASSLVREKQGASLAGTTFDERWLIVDLENSLNATKHTQVFCDRRRPCITLPGPENTRRFEFKLLPGETDADMLRPDVVRRLLDTHGADPQATLRRKVVYRFHARVAPQWQFGRVFLAGDAAHLTPPFAGQGMNSGIRDACNLAWKLHEVLGGRLGPELLRSYETERKDHVWQMIDLALRMGRVMAPRSWWRGFALQTAFLSLKAVPPARDYVAQMKYKPPPRFRTGFLVPDGRGRRSLVGRMLPQPWVRKTDGGEVLLDEAIGHGFALLAYGEDAVASLGRLSDGCWEPIEPRCIAVLPAGATAPRHEPGTIVVTCADEAFAAAMAPHARQMLLLRPDRYVAAAMPASDLHAQDMVARALRIEASADHVAAAVPTLERAVVG